MAKRLLQENTKGWYKPESGLWGERYYEEHRNVLTPERNAFELEIVKRYLKPEYKTILDAPCGFGRFSNPLSKMGYEVTGIDLDPFFIELAKKEAKKQKTKVEYKRMNLLDLNTEEKFDVVLNLFTSIGYLDTEAENKALILKLGQAVKNHGRLILEVINPVGILVNYLSTDENTTPGGVRITYEREYDPTTSVNIERIIHNYPNGQTFSGVNRIRLYYPHELVNICSENNLKLIDILSYDGSKYTEKAYRMWLIFEKNEK